MSSITKIKKSLEFLEDILDHDEKALQAISYLKGCISNTDFEKEKDHFSADFLFPLPSEVQGEGEFALFSDGGCRGNPGPGSWGCLAQNHRGEVLFECSSFDEMTTNNKMELLGAIRAIEELLEIEESPKKIFLYTDSKYLKDGFQSWMQGWKRRGWKKSDGKPVLNLDLWKRIDAFKENLRHLEIIWVKGHNGHPQNERCDQLCNIILDREFG